MSWLPLSKKKYQFEYFLESRCQPMKIGVSKWMSKLLSIMILRISMLRVLWRGIVRVNLKVVI